MMIKKLAICALVVTATVAGAASAAPRSHEYWVYHADETLSNPVGSYTLTCAGNIYRTGIETPYIAYIISKECKATLPEPWPN